MTDVGPPALGQTPAIRLSPTQAVALAIGVVLVVLLSLAIGRLSAPNSAPPSTTSAEAGFARDMQEHHNQAVELSMIVRDRTDDPDTRLLAYDIATSQSQQSGQMFGWLAEWGLPQAPAEPSMTWMLRPPLGGDGVHGGSAHDEPAGGDPADGGEASETNGLTVPSPGMAMPGMLSPGMPMPGMATREQIVQLEALSGREAEAQFLELMIAHHRGGVEMAKAILERSDVNVVRDLASSILSAQQSETALMERMLTERR
ncbi:MAG: DUF305 domain-containing protein [Salinibacterium sp.]|nr:DUF305 domain-containing protein [Salinibacterium sp.]